MTEIRKCLNCEIPITGRFDKKFCSHYCRNAYNKKINQNNNELFKVIDRRLKKNRSILKRLNPAEENTVRKEQLVDMGFNFNYITHYLKAEDSRVFLFCYEYGYRDLKKDEKFLLVKWNEII